MAISTEEIGIIKATLQHCEDNTTDMQPHLMRNPVSTYTDPENLKNEVETLFRKFPIIVGHIQQLADPGAFLPMMIPACPC